MVAGAASREGTELEASYERETNRVIIYELSLGIVLDIVDSVLDVRYVQSHDVCQRGLPIYIFEIPQVE